jgi:uncharacterized coiled-coil DUF342 family protein
MTTMLIPLTDTPTYYLVDPGTFQAFLAVVGLVLVALAGYSANKSRLNAKKLDRAVVTTTAAKAAVQSVADDVNTVKNSVVNDHKKEDGSPLGLRDDNDEKHTESMAAITQVATDLRQFAKSTNGKFTSLGKDLGGIRHELRDARGDIGNNRDRILELEKTTPRAEVRRAVAKATRKTPTRKATP